MSVIEGIITDYFCVKVTLVNFGAEKRLCGFGFTVPGCSRLRGSRMVSASLDNRDFARPPGLRSTTGASLDHRE